jgi:hypothetical protein
LERHIAASSRRWPAPLLDTAHQVTIPSPTPAETVVTRPTMPGLELHLPAGTVITNKDKKIVRTLTLTPIPLDRTPFPMRGRDVHDVLHHSAGRRLPVHAGTDQGRVARLPEHLTLAGRCSRPIL